LQQIYRYFLIFSQSLFQEDFVIFVINIKQIIHSLESVKYYVQIIFIKEKFFRLTFEDQYFGTPFRIDKTN